MFSIREIADIIIMTLALGYIFSDFFRREPVEGYEPLEYYQKPPLVENIRLAAIIVAPAIVLHELAHKFTALFFGASATLHAPYFWYLFVIILKLIGFPLLFFVGGYVTHTALPPLQSSLVSIAGPLLNLILWLASLAAVKYRLINRRHYKIIALIGRINLFLFIFNMLPLPGFDGYHFFAELFRAFV